MIKTLRTRLVIGLLPLMAAMIGLGVWATVMFYRLGSNIDVILRENYRSVLAAQNMKEALERMDSALLFAIGGRDDRGKAQFEEFRPVFEKNLRIESSNVTLAGEQDIVNELTQLYGRYVSQAGELFALPNTPASNRTELYFGSLLPTFNRIKDRAGDVLNLNQRHMEAMDHRAREAAARSIRVMILALAGATAVALVVLMMLSRSILEPIQAVTRGARALGEGDVDQVVPVLTSDELGELASTFNTMARTIREYRQAGAGKLVRAQQTAQATIDSFPDPVVVVDTTGTIERANPAARRVLTLAPSGGTIPWIPPHALKPLLAGVLAGEPDQMPIGLEHAIAGRDNGQERFYLPRVLAIRGPDDVPLGAAVVLQDVTRFRLLDQLKSDMVSTVSHELKTPLTSIQMVVHLLLEEVVGPLAPKQVELLLAARQDSDRLLAMVNDLLDLTRIEQGRIKLDRRTVTPATLLAEAAVRHAARGADAGVSIATDLADGLPSVSVDKERIEHVFDNLIANAIAHTHSGGRVTVAAMAEGADVVFTVADDGEGIPAAHLSRIFEKFYQVPGARGRGGAGLGLAITREILIAHGGEIHVASTPGEGTRFTFHLPAAKESGPTPGGVERHVG